MEATVALHPLGNTGNQDCFLGEDLMIKLNVKLGTFLKLQHGDRANICCAWLGTDLGGMTSQYSDTVYRSSGATLADDGKRFNTISALKPVRADSIVVTVIFSKLSAVQEYRHSNSYSESLKGYCSNCLIKSCVAKSYIVNCEKMRLGKLYGISHIVIENAISRGKPDSECFIVTKDTEIIIDAVHSKDWFDQTCNRKPATKLGGLEREIEMLNDLVRLPLERREQFKELGTDPPHGILLRGPPGCGKTSLVQYVSTLCGACLITVNGPELFASLPGETEANLRKLFDKAAMLGEEGACILFVDEIDSVCSRGGKSSRGQEARVTGQFVTLMDGLRTRPNVLVIGATNRPSALDPALRRPGRFDREVIIGAPNIQQRKDILAAKVAPLPVADDLDLDNLAGITNGYVGADLAALCHEAAYLAMAEMKGQGHTGNTRKITQSHFEEAFRKICPSLQKGSEGLVDLRPVHWSVIGGLDTVKTQIKQKGREGLVDLRPVHWSDIGGLETVKTQIKQAVEWPIQHPEAFQRMGLSPPKGVLLYGPPGCAKTTLVRAAATACRATFLAISGAQLYSPYVGDSERLIAEVFQKARACAPSIILLDEIDSIVGKRSETARSGVQERVLSALLNEMDGIGVRLDDGAVSSRQQKVLEGNCSGKQENSHTAETTVDNSSVLVVAATNRPDLLDEALVRPGRIDRVVYVPSPDIEARRQILNIYSQKFGLGDSVLDDVAEKTDMYTGADLENLCREAALCALTEDLSAARVTSDHVYTAMKSVSASLTPDLIQQYSNVSLATFNNKHR